MGKTEQCYKITSCLAIKKAELVCSSDASEESSSETGGKIIICLCKNVTESNRE